MADPFERKAGETSGVGRLLGRAGKTALREIEDLLARAQRVREVEPDLVKEVADRHGVDLGRRLRTPRRNLYRRFFEYCLVDHALSDDEIADLSHLRAILELPEDDIAEVHEYFVDEQIKTRFLTQDGSGSSAGLTVYKVGDQDAVEIAGMVRSYVRGRRFASGASRTTRMRSIFSASLSSSASVMLRMVVSVPKSWSSRQPNSALMDWLRCSRRT